MQKITTFLTYNNQAEEAVALYTSLFADSKITSTMRHGDAVLMVEFELAGQRYLAMNGGPTFSFAQGTSLLVNCESQEEVDRLWSSLTANGGRESQCGWLVDRFGVSWQIIPTILPKLVGDKDQAKAGRAMQAMLKMKKIDIAELKRAHEG